MGLDPASVAAVDGSRRDATDAARGGSVLPLARGYAFAEIPPTVERLLAGGEGGLPRAALGDVPDRVAGVVLVFLDAFGWRFFTRHADRHPLLRRFLEHGTVAKLTTQFPSTTVAHVTTIHTGRPVADHGMYEWNIYEPSVGALVTPLMFSFAGDGERDTLRGAGADPHAMYPTGDALSPPGRPRRAVRRLPPGLVRAVDLRRGPRRRRDAVPRTRPWTRPSRRSPPNCAPARAGLHVRVHRHRRRDRPSVRPVLAGVRRRGDPLPRRDRGRDRQAPGRHAGAPRRRPRPGRGRSRPDPLRQRAVAGHRRPSAARHARPADRSRGLGARPLPPHRAGLAAARHRPAARRCSARTPRFTPRPTSSPKACSAAIPARACGPGSGTSACSRRRGRPCGGASADASACASAATTAG